MKSIDIYCPARINLFFKVNGYNKSKALHYLKLINQTINMYDIINIKPSRNSNLLTINTTEEIFSILYEDLSKTYEIFLNYVKLPPHNISITITKNIPTKSGLGDKGSIIAGFLIALNMIYNSRLEKHELIFLASLINFEAPYFIVGNYAKITNTGNKITPLDNNPYKSYLIITPNIDISTKEMFHKLDSNYSPTNIINNLLYNDFISVMPSELLRIRDFLSNYPNIDHSLSALGPSYYIASPTYIEPSLKKVLKKEFPDYKIYNQKNSQAHKIITYV